MAFHRFFNHGHDFKKSDPFRKEGGYTNFISGIQDRRGAASTQRLTGNRSAGKRSGSGVFEVEASDHAQIETFRRCRNPRWPSQCISDRCSHVRRSQLRQDRAVYISHHAVNYRLWVHYHIDTLLRHRKNMMCFTTFRPLFIMVAESTDILAPISQLGWATACSGVTPRIFSMLNDRNGPPDAVSIIFRLRQCVQNQSLIDRIMLRITGNNVDPHCSISDMSSCRRRLGIPCLQERPWRPSTAFAFA